MSHGYDHTMRNIKNLLGYRYALLFLFTCLCSRVSAQEFYAYYTEINKGEVWEAMSRNTEHPDIVVKMGAGQLVFWRGKSYLPYWETKNGKWNVKEMIARSGDGPADRPDATNSFSFARVISSDDKEIVIHWRYLPHFKAGNPKKEVEHLNFVDEYYTIQPDGQVARSIKQGSDDVDVWLNDLNIINQTFRLTLEGIQEGETATPTTASNMHTPVQGNPLKEASLTPVMHLKFDEGVGDKTSESISGSKASIEGHKSYWKKGVSRTCLAFDGYVSKVELTGDLLADINEFTVEAWVALGAYPFNWAPIIQQTDHGNSGFYFGVGPSGKLTLRMKAQKWNEVSTEMELPLRKWTHVAASIEEGVIRIYIDGKEVANQLVEGPFQSSEENLLIGFNNHKQIPGDPVRSDCEECHLPVLFGFDGLIDEVKVYDDILSSDKIKSEYELFKPSSDFADNPDLEKRVLPVGPSTGEFTANYTSLKYYETWDNLSRFGDHADVVVEFEDLPTRFIFWRGMSYVPQVVNAENQWYNNQFNESWDPGGSWGEPMSDKQSLRSHVRIIENTPARKVIHWRYAQVQINGTQQNYDEQIGWGDWSDWYYYIYPDGVACKRMVHWSGDDPSGHEWQESIGVMGPGQTPDNISDVYGETVFFDDYGVTKSYNWSDSELDPVDNIPARLETDWEKRPLKIQVVNYRSDFKPFTIGDFRGGECYGDADGMTAPYSNMVVYTHWPLGQLPTDGTRAFKPDRGSSNGYTHLMFKGDHQKGKNWAERVMMEGMSNKSAMELRPLAKSWLDAPKVKGLIGASGGEYDKAQRAYLFALSDVSNKLDFSIAASPKSPIENLCFVVKNWNSKQLAVVQKDNLELSAKHVRQGIARDTDGSRNLVVYVNYKSEEQVSFSLSK